MRNKFFVPKILLLVLVLFIGCFFPFNLNIINNNLVYAQSEFFFAPLALKKLEVTAFPLAVTENKESQINLTLRDVTTASTPAVIAPDSQVTVIVGSYITTATVGDGGVARITLPPEVVTGGRLVAVVIVPGYQRMVFSLVVRPSKSEAVLPRDEEGRLVVELRIGSFLCRVNDRAVRLPVAPYIKEGRTMVPVRFFTEVLGYTVDYDFSDPAMKKVMIYTPDSLPNTAVRENQQAKKATPFITLFIDQTTVIIGGISVDVDSAPELVRGTTMVPLRFVAQTLGFYVEWKDPVVKLISTF
ncbi:copper amine oxidase [Coprothermobacter proteolyticus DSM 5265]|uniref:Copper amine oxidase N-domain family n=1 Tax=Coprothermobacter proteolyticus (strain ATCC 35245 / DSM 5265 / OCM 4 / BT) TaxID=309798 RepID=B5Y6Q4_COPPD|nr:copper amine oxidase N-terminal domain-containing protein [Coprothermobacter proteolyticus]ACI18156.1 copper amine oxidase [Coprothermobacter proteolyticus DSM 5265]